MAEDEQWLEWLQQEHAYAEGHRDGHAGDRIDADLVVQPEYRRGLSEGRTHRIDDELRALADTPEYAHWAEPGARAQARKIRDYRVARDRWS